MDFFNPHLKDYIYKNTSEKIRGRAIEVLIKEAEYDEQNEVANFKVIGSKEYLISVNNYKSDKISAVCTCPYDYGAVCKHIVAVIKVIDEYLGLPKKNNQDVVTEANSLYQFNAETSTYIFSKNFVSNIDYEHILKVTTKPVYTQSKSVRLHYSYFDDSNKTLHLSLSSDYWGTTFFQILVSFTDSHVYIQTDCRCKKTRVCKHVIFTLETLAKEYSFLLLSEKEVNAQKEKALNAFGFTLQDNYQKYFTFKNTPYGPKLQHKVKGILSLDKAKELADFKEKIIFSKELLQDYLPQMYKNKKALKQLKVGLGIHFSDDGSDVFLTPIIGNTDKNGVISTNINILDYKLFVDKQDEIDNEIVALVKLAYDLSIGKRVNRKKQGYFSSKITALQELIRKANIAQIPFYEMLDFDYQKVYKKNLHSIDLQINTGALTFEVREKDIFIETNAFLKIKKKKKLNAYDTQKHYLFAKEDETYYLHLNQNICDVIRFFSQVPSFKVLPKDFQVFKNNVLIPLEEKYLVTYYSKTTQPIRKNNKNFFKKQLYLSQLNNFILFKPAVAVEQQIIPLYSHKKVIVSKENLQYEIARDKKLEDNFNFELRGLHPKFEHQNNDFFFLHEDEFVEDEWFLKFIEKTKAYDIEIFGRNDLKLKYNQNKASISININSGIDWFDVAIKVAFGDQVVTLKDLKKNIINKDKYISLKDGTIGILPEEWMQKYFAVFKSGSISKDAVKVSKYQFSVVDVLYENYQNQTNLFEEHLKIKERLQKFSAIKNIKLPKGINATLRPYQKEGLKWLNFLDDFNLGGCLADDMGLGKTLQIITFLKHLKSKKKIENAHLVVVPTSLIFNWNEELLKFCPELKTYTHTGANRSRETTHFDSYDIILTTYGLVVNDAKLLNEYTFHYVILDESQAIKNPNSKRYKSIKVLKAKNRLVMTGTPIENNTFDLYAQMNFINPGLLGGIQQFRTDYANAIDKNKDVEVAEELRQIIHPFLMRRTKEQVISDLPPKTEQILYCEMGKEQRKVYEAHKNEYRNYLMGKIEEEGIEKSQIYILQALTKLRQICNSPSLLSDGQEYANESVKIDLLLENIQDKTRNHKILVFSQFTSMLNLIKNRLDDVNMNYEYLDGATRNRQGKVDNFQTQEDTRIFLISLKAGGTGLNLTAADYVYIVDPWWNPAAEAQAIDRCYRIGQDKKVMAYKMICKNSIEEKIIQLQEGKKQVSSDLIQTEKSFVKKLDKTSLQDLFN